MPVTTFRLLHDGESLDLGLTAFQSMLPSSMTVIDRDGDFCIEVNSQREEDACAQFHLARELDRLFFLTGVRVKPEMCRRTAFSEQRFAWSVHGSIPSGTAPQTWNYALGVQLRLWALACEAVDPLAKIVLLYQIIELSAPTFPKYSDSAIPPDPLTECKLLRDLIVHAGDVDGRQLRTYCAYLNVAPLMLDRTDDAYVELLLAKCSLVEQQAKLILQNAL